MKALMRLAALLLSISAVAPASLAQGIGAFEIHIDREAFGEATEADLFIAFAKEGEPRQRMHEWIGAPPLLRFKLQLSPGEDVVTLTDADAVLSHPVDWAQMPFGEWSVQAIARLSRTGRQAGHGPGDVYSGVASISYDPASEEAVSLTLDRIVIQRPFRETEQVRLFKFTSPALSEFHGFDYTMRAGVLLPKNYGSQESYPFVYSVTGFGGTYQSIKNWQRRIPAGSPLEQCIIVVPDASNRYGHSVFCDSPSIGPWGEALVRELIPALEQEYGGAGAQHRYVTGVSSGGWSSLWLQVNYPSDFAGCWSHVPDPIDFHDFQQINLYEPLPDGKPRNMYVDESGAPRPVARQGTRVMLTYEEFVRRENVLSPGGQIRSFEATFSPPLQDGTPRRVFDVETGEIDHAAAQAWRPYDISHQLLTNWDDLREGLAGKLHVYAGEMDSFYLQGAVERFRGLAEKAGILDEMVVEVIPGMPHTLYAAGHQLMIDTIAERWKASDN